jgi:hypothetical protein
MPFFKYRLDQISILLIPFPLPELCTYYPGIYLSMILAQMLIDLCDSTLTVKLKGSIEGEGSVRLTSTLR